MHFWRLSEIISFDVPLLYLFSWCIGFSYFNVSYKYMDYEFHLPNLDRT